LPEQNTKTNFVSDPEYQVSNDQDEQQFNKNGEPQVDEKESFFTKIITKETGKHTSTCYYIRVHDSTLFDPTGTNSFRVKYLDTKMRKVSKTAFDYYMIYLKTKNSIYLTKAQRSFLDG
jgi:hypothetical protein